MEGQEKQLTLAAVRDGLHPHLSAVDPVTKAEGDRAQSFRTTRYGTLELRAIGPQQSPSDVTTFAEMLTAAIANLNPNALLPFEVDGYPAKPLTGSTFSKRTLMFEPRNREIGIIAMKRLRAFVGEAYWEWLRDHGYVPKELIDLLSVDL